MKKFIAFGFLLIMISLLIAQGLHRIDKNARILGWLAVRGEIYPLWNEKYDLGKQSYWWDSAFVAYPELRSAIIWGADSVDTTFLTPTLVKSRFGLFDTCSSTVWLGIDAVMSGNDIIDSLNNATRTATRPWTFDSTITCGGNVNSGIVMMNILSSGFNYDAITLNQNSGDNTYIGFNHIISSDSITLDSVTIVWRAQEADSNELDSICVSVKASLTEGLVNSIKWADGTDKTAQADGYDNVTTWTGINTRLAPWDFFVWYIKCDHTAANGDVSIRNWVAFYSY